jgi:hypothetical protein
MPQRDYILRMIEQLGQALIRLRRMIMGGEASPEAVDDELRSVARGVGFDVDMARVASADTLAMLVSTGGEVDPSRCWVFAELLYLDAMEAEMDGRVEMARAGYDKALSLFSLLEPAGGFLVGWPEAGERVDEIRSRLDGLARGERPE